MAGNWLIRRGQSKVVSALLILALLFSSFGLLNLDLQEVYAADDEITVSVRIEGADKTFLQHTELKVGKFDIEPFIEDSTEGFSEPTEVVSAHALIEAVYYSIYGNDPAISDLSSPSPTVAENITAKLKISLGAWGLSLNSINNDSDIVMSMINNEGGMGIGSDSLLSGDSIVFYGPWTKTYSYFDADSMTYSDSRLSIKLMEDVWGTKLNVAGASIIASSSAITVPAITGEDGFAELTFTENGEYLISTEDKDLVRPYAKVVISGAGCSIIHPAQNLKIEELKLSAIDVLEYVNSKGLYVLPYNIGKISLSAISVPVGTTYSAIYYKTNGDSQAVSIGDDINIDEGSSSIIFSLRNELKQTKDYKLSLKRQTETENKIEDIEAVLAAISEKEGFESNSYWVMVMAALGESLTDEQKSTYLGTVLSDSVKDVIDVGTISKHIIVLANMGIDPQKVLDLNDNPINLVKMVYDYKTDLGEYGIYTAPFMLLALDSYDFGIPADANWTRSNLISYILEDQDEVTGAWTSDWQSAGNTASVLFALAPHTNVDGVSQAAVKAFNYISANQESSGDYGSAYDTAFVVLAASMFGKDPDSDLSFVTGSAVSAYKGLMNYRIDSGQYLNMFSDYGSYNLMSTIAAYKALASYKTFMDGNDPNIFKTNKALTAYDDWPREIKLLTGIKVTNKPNKLEYSFNEGSGEVAVSTEGAIITAYFNNDESNNEAVTNYTITKIDTSSSGTKQVTVTYQGHEATFNVTVKDQSGATPQLYTVKITVRSSGKGVIASDSAYAVEPGKTTVQDVLKAVLTKANKSYTIIGGYVAEIDGLSEFDQGENSGWMYLVNGVDPVKAAGSYTLNGGETIEWKYTLDYTKESGANKWNPEQAKETAPAGKDDLNAALADIKAGRADSWTADTAKGSISFDKDALAGLIDEMGNNKLEVSIEETPTKSLTNEQKEAAGSRPVFDIKVTVGNNNIKSFDGKLIISIPYKLKEGELPTGIVVYHLNDKGELTPMEGHYDPATGKVIFTVDHLSLYVIAYDETKAVWPFTDVKQSSDNWYYDAVKYTYEKGVFSGTSPNKFSPDVSLSRAMLAGALARISDADLAAYKESGFSDVDINTWYGSSVAWAKEAGVVSGYENKDGTFSFRPEDKISRQDIALMIHNFNEKVQKKAYDKVDAVKFKDKAEIPEYAKAAVQAMQEAGIISGFKDKDGNFDYRPAENTSRAQAASLIYNVLTK